MNLKFKFINYFTLLIYTVLTVFLVSCGKSPEEQKQISKDVIINTVSGLGNLEENDLESAEFAFLRVIELAPDKSKGYANLGLTYLRMGKIEEAERQLLKAIDIEGDNPDIRLILAKTYEMNQQIDKSAEQLHYNLKIDPNHVKTLYELSKQHSLTNDPMRKVYLQKLTTVLPGNIVPKLQLIEVYIKNNDSDKALQLLEVLQQQFPEFPTESIPYYKTSQNLLQVGKTNESLTPFIMFHNYMKTSTIFQSGIAELEGPGENLTGFPIISYDPMGMWSEAGKDSSILEIISFTDITSSIGLDLIANYTSLNVSDFDNDGDYDVYLGGSDTSTIPKLYRNNFGHYEDITATSGITHIGNELSSLYGDYNNDGFLDLFIIKTNEHILYQNKGKEKFENVSKHALPTQTGSGNKATFFDLDHDGDLDLVIVSKGNTLIYRNNGDGTFLDYTSKSGINNPSEMNGVDVCFGDFDGDGVTDFAVANENGSNIIYRNQRHGQFTEFDIANNTSIGTGGISITSGDYNNDGFLDLLIINKKGYIELYQNLRDGNFKRDSKAELSLTNKNIILSMAKFWDFDNDGLQDIVSVGFSQNNPNGTIKLHRNNGSGIYEDASYLLPSTLNAKKVVPIDFDDDGDLDLFILNNEGVRLFRNDGGNVNHYLKINLVGLRSGNGKNNHFGIGSKIEVRSGDRYQMKTVTEPVTYFGLGSRPVAEVVRIQWTNGVPQNIYFPEGNATVLEKQLLKGSCPFLYTWDGDKYVFVKDILWRSALGMPLGIMAETSTYAFPNAAQDYLKIPGEMLQQKDGLYNLQITSELWETIYFDKLELIAIDHPSSFEVYVDEKFTPPPYPEHKLFKVSEERVPVSVSDGEGNDLTSLITSKDNNYIANFELTKYQGVTENTTLELNLGDNINTNNLFLFLNGWIFPSDASINTAISQSSEVKLIPPILQVLNPKGEWQTLETQIGFPMGKNKTIIIDLSNVFLTDDYRVRILTNLQIYWDYIFFSNIDEKLPIQKTTLIAQKANLHYRGYSAMERKGNRYGPHWFDYLTVDTGQKWLDLTGDYTRYGDIQPLLTHADDMYAITNSGDEMTITFDANKAPKLPTGWKRDFIIYSEGWVKDGDLNTASGNTVNPLPFHGMTQYPYNTNLEHYPTDSLHQSYQRDYNNRSINTQEYDRTIIDF